MKPPTPSISLFLAVVLMIPAFSLRAWDRIIDFQEFAIGDYDGSGENPINETTVHITRDEGWEGDNTGGAVIQRIRGSDDGNRYYSVYTRGRGSHWGHAFSLVNWPTPITGIGTIYWEFMQVGPSSEYILGAAVDPAVAVNPGEEGYTPWGWTGMTEWRQTRTGVLKNPSNMWLVMSGAWHPVHLEDPKVHFGCWYQVWQHLEVCLHSRPRWRSPPANPESESPDWILELHPQPRRRSERSR